MDSCICSCIIYILKSFIEFGSFICVCILCHSSKTNPFENHYIGNLSNYFKYEINSSVPIINNKYNNVLNNSINIQEHIFNEMKKYY